MIKWANTALLRDVSRKTIKCPTCEGKGQVFKFAMDGSSWEYCPSCDGDKVVSLPAKMSLIKDRDGAVYIKYPRTKRYSRNYLGYDPSDYDSDFDDGFFEAFHHGDW